MGLTRDMAVLCKRIHVEILYALVFVNIKDELIIEYMTQIDDLISNCLDLLHKKQLLSIEERKELAEIARDIQKVYDAIDKNELDDKVMQLLEHIMNAEHDAIKNEIAEHELNGSVEKKLGELHDVLTALIERTHNYKYERSEDLSQPNPTLFDALFKIESTNDLFKKIKVIQKQFAQECLIMSAIEDLYKKIGQGEVQLHDLLEKVGVDPEHNKAELAQLPIDTIKEILREAELLAEEIEEEEERA